MIDPNQAIAGFLRRSVEQKRCKQKDLADLCGISEQAVSKWMKSGHVELANLVKIAGFLSVSLDEMVGRETPVDSDDLTSIVQVMRTMEPPQRYMCQKIIRAVADDSGGPPRSVG